MSRYRVSTMLTISVSIEVDAPSEKAAIKKAFARDVADLCHYCANPNRSCDEGAEVWAASELDGVPSNDKEHISVERIDDVGMGDGGDE